MSAKDSRKAMYDDMERMLGRPLTIDEQRFWHFRLICYVSKETVDYQIETQEAKRQLKQMRETHNRLKRILNKYG